MFAILDIVQNIPKWESVSLVDDRLAAFIAVTQPVHGMTVLHK